MDARKHDFPVSGRRKLFKFRTHIQKRPASNRPARIWDNAIGTESVASFLNLQMCTRSSFMRNSKRFKGMLSADIRNRMLFSLLERFRQPYHIRPLLRANHKAHARQCQHLLRRALGIAPCDNDFRLRSKRMRAGDHLAGFLIARLCYGASVYNVNIRRFTKVHDFIARVLKQLPHRFRIVLVHLAPKRAKGCLHLLFLILPIHKAPLQAPPCRPFLCAGCADRAKRVQRCVPPKTPPHRMQNRPPAR